MTSEPLAISTICPRCGVGLILPGHFGGEWHTCPACWEEFQVPDGRQTVQLPKAGLNAAQE